MNEIQHTIYLIQEREKRLSVEFEALKAHTLKLIQLVKDQATEIATLKSTPPPASDPAPSDVAALDAEIAAVLPPA
jgi:hypothetical protein